MSSGRPRPLTRWSDLQDWSAPCLLGQCPTFPNRKSLVCKAGTAQKLRFCPILYRFSADEVETTDYTDGRMSLFSEMKSCVWNLAESCECRFEALCQLSLSEESNQARPRPSSNLAGKKRARP